MEMDHIRGGIDMVLISRIRDSYSSGAFLKRVFTDEEILHSFRGRLPYRQLAGLFAVKEAVMKAIGTGWSKEVDWKEIEVLPGLSGGRPEVRTSARVHGLLGRKSVHASIAYSDALAIAFAVVE